MGVAFTGSPVWRSAILKDHLSTPSSQNKFASVDVPLLTEIPASWVGPASGWSLFKYIKLSEILRISVSITVVEPLTVKVSNEPVIAVIPVILIVGFTETPSPLTTMLVPASTATVGVAEVPFVTSIPSPSPTAVTVPADEPVINAANWSIVVFLVILSPLSLNAILSPAAIVWTVKSYIFIPKVVAPEVPLVTFIPPFVALAMDEI